MSQHFQIKTTAIILAAGQGKRMQSDKPKQYLEICGHPILYYTIKAFEASLIDEIILVTGKGEIEYCQKEIVEKYQFKKVKKIIEGGKERYHSVYQGLKAVEETDYVYIHDGARLFVTPEMIEKVLEEVKEHKACVIGMPVKDTIKIADIEQNVCNTPDRKYVWAVQTPQVFQYQLIKNAYDLFMKEEDTSITDDAMVLEKMLGCKIKLVEGSYQNIKITTPEDLKIAEVFLKINEQRMEL